MDLSTNSMLHSVPQMAFWWNCYWHWHNVYYYPRSELSPVHPEEPVAKQRKLEDSLAPSTSPPLISSELTKLKGKPGAGRLGLISFRPQSDTNPRPRKNLNRLTSDHQSNQKLVLSHPSKRRHEGDIVRVCVNRKTRRSSRPERQSLNASSNLCQESFEGKTTIYDVHLDCLSRIFHFLDVPSKGRAAQVCRSWKDICYLKSNWTGVEAKLHLKKSNSTLFDSLYRRGIKKVQVLSLKRSLRELIHGIPNMESLNLSGCFNLTEASLSSAFRRDIPSLKFLNLSLCKEVSDNNLATIANYCYNLENLDLAGCSKVSNNGLGLISNNMIRLRSLNLRSCRLISDQGIAHITGQNTQGLRGLPRLEDLVLQDCQKITDEGLKYLSQGIQSLRAINLSFCVSITDTGIKSLGRIPTLVDLNLRSCDNVSDLGIGFLSEGVCGKGLEVLDVSFCVNVTDSSAKNISAGITHLKKLAMANCSLSDDGLNRLTSSLKTLECLNIGQCKAISDKSLEILAKEMVQLKHIDLYGCSKVSDRVLKTIRNMPKMSELNLHLL